MEAAGEAASSQALLQHLHLVHADPAAAARAKLAAMGATFLFVKARALASARQGGARRGGGVQAGTGG